MMRFVIVLAALLAPAPALAAPLTIMVEDASEPFSRADGSGYANDIVRAAFKASGIDVRLDVLPYARCKRSVEQGATPACFAMSWTPDMAGKVVFSDQPLFEVYADIFRRKDAPGLGPETWRIGAVMGQVIGYEYPGVLADLAKQGVKFESAADETSILRMLARGRLDAGVVMTSDFVTGPQRLAAENVQNAVTFGYRSGTMKSYLGFSTRHPEGENARNAFNSGYQIIIKNGTRDAIRARWMKTGPR